MEGMKAVVFRILALASVANTALASTSCDQTFTFLGLTRGSQPVLWIAETLGGECYSAQLVQVILSEPNAAMAATDIPSREIAWLKDIMENFATEKALALEATQGRWAVRGMNWHIRPPQARSDLATAFAAHVAAGGSNGSSWNAEQGLRAVITPELGNAKARLIYAYPAGLYFNYDIAQAYYFPRRGLLLVFTRQKMLAVGLDTMHGFMVLKISQ
ncbi:MAG TPA: hypothetical protein P5279_08940 [Anaerohalosphaeraceae bacterium]|jgi:hypothetical protein|nr:hypothetical protein [Anaerohalosphaeraceae bacterium]HRT50605.1 hypothetical protein [Anaerohalosphaeraceae bacterium]HRT86570.1 hypothetical protein [Anaerohalosphaeraceae bacterium]